MDTQDKTAAEEKVFSRPVTVLCGANSIALDDLYGLHTVGELRSRLREVLNVRDDHTVVLVNGKSISEPERYLVQEGDQIEFKKPAGEKGL